MDFFCFPTQCYGQLSGRVGKIFVSTLAAEIGGIRGRKYNAEQEIVFQTVILQQFHLVTGAKNIHA